MDQFPSNAHNPKVTPQETDKPKATRVVEGNVIRREKSLGKKIAEFFGGSGRGVLSYVVETVLVPAAKDMVHDAVLQGLEHRLWGDSRIGNPGARRPGAGPVPYNRYSTSPTVSMGYQSAPVRPPMSKRARTVHDFGEIILATRREGEDVIRQMFTLLEQYQVVTVADLYDMTGQESSWADRKFGWVDLSGADVRRVKDGYLLDLPRPEPLD